MSEYSRWRDIRAEYVERAGGEEVVAAGKQELLAAVLGHRLAEVRRARGLTQQQVAERMRITKGRVSQIEQGKVSDDLPTHEIARAELEAGIVLATLAADAGLAGSRGEARRLAQGGGLRLNDKPELDANRAVTAADLVDGVVKLAAGKKKIVLVKPV